MNIFSEAFLLRFLKFGIVGFSGVFVDFGVTYLCKEKLKINKYVANASGFVIAATSNYFLNRIWTFHSKNPNIGVEYFYFFLISIVGLAINTCVIYILNGRLKWNFYLSKLFAIGTATIWNFLANYYFTFA